MYYIDLAVTGISFGCMYAMMSVGLTLVYGLLRILHVAHAAVFALGAYVTVLVANATGSIALGFLASILRHAAVRHGDLSPALRAAAEIPARRADDRLGRAAGADAGRLPHRVRRAGRHLSPTTRSRSRPFNFAGITVNAVQIAIVVAAAIVFAGLHLFTTRTRDRHRLARHRLEAADRGQLRHRSDQGALSQFRRSARRWPRSPAAWSRC